MLAGGKLKETGLTHWISPNTGATNESGFMALPAGSRNTDGSFGMLGYLSRWWSATENDATFSWGHAVYESLASNWIGGYNKSEGFSVRCVKD